MQQQRILRHTAQSVRRDRGRQRGLRGRTAWTAQRWQCVWVVNVNVNNLLAISESDFDTSGEPGPQAKVVGAACIAAPTPGSARPISARGAAMAPAAAVGAGGVVRLWLAEGVNVNVNNLLGCEGGDSAGCTRGMAITRG